MNYGRTNNLSDFQIYVSGFSVSMLGTPIKLILPIKTCVWFPKFHARSYNGFNYYFVITGWDGLCYTRHIVPMKFTLYKLGSLTRNHTKRPLFSLTNEIREDFRLSQARKMVKIKEILPKCKRWERDHTKLRLQEEKGERKNKKPQK